MKLASNPGRFSSVGIGRVARACLGSTATEVAEGGADDATELPTIIGPHTEETGYSVLIARS
jgi:hypothetical protein